ncbi:helix-turn-helix transcriptional regulator [Pseudoalteromonas sp. T1lg48]|uniref:helix-turn-helix transcriptional regulator n=1 Tax=Pseudoalteromonas sp. T1lg48 TaxID=2077100 RepID=UPI0018F8B658|nr:AlpA family phage regulatory protein [Pseudoalteromonas sp. T1lg48]
MEPCNTNNNPLFIKINETAGLATVSVPTFYRKVAQGLMPKPVKLGPRAVAWLKDEIIAVNQALVLGYSKMKLKL